MFLVALTAIGATLAAGMVFLMPYLVAMLGEQNAVYACLAIPVLPAAACAYLLTPKP